MLSYLTVVASKSMISTLIGASGGEPPSCYKIIFEKVKPIKEELPFCTNFWGLYDKSCIASTKSTFLGSMFSRSYVCKWSLADPRGKISLLQHLSPDPEILTLVKMAFWTCVLPNHTLYLHKIPNIFTIIWCLCWYMIYWFVLPPPNPHCEGPFLPLVLVPYSLCKCVICVSGLYVMGGVFAFTIGVLLRCQCMLSRHTSTLIFCKCQLFCSFLASRPWTVEFQKSPWPQWSNPSISLKFTHHDQHQHDRHHPAHFNDEKLLEKSLSVTAFSPVTTFLQEATEPMLMQSASASSASTSSASSLASSS